MGLTHNLQTEVHYQIGKPLSHSVVAKVHNALNRDLGINALFIPLELDETDLPLFMKSLKVYNVKGLGATMPFKTKIGAYLDKLEKTAGIFHCVNNVSFDENGVTTGYAVDGIGMCRALEVQGIGINGKNVLLLGAGGVSGVVAAELSNRGAKKIFITNRTLTKAQAIADKINDNYTAECKAIEFTPGALDIAAEQSTLVMQCTSLGMHGVTENFTYLGFLDKLPRGAAVADAIYNPDPTKILDKARSMGIETINGMPMLACQLAETYKLVYHFDMPADGWKLALQYMRDAMAGKLFND
ncbi:MAG: shikimate dehydrogenase family protein [Christensenellales bacterium]